MNDAKREPRTPTGKRQHDLAWSQTGLPVLGDHGNDPEGCSACRFIARIEREAATRARQAIRAMCKERNPDHDDRWCRICTDMVDPVDD